MQEEKGLLKPYKLLQMAGLPLIPMLASFCLLHRKYRSQFMARIGVHLPKLDKRTPKIWIHAMSLGEYNAARPLIKAISSAIPDAILIVSASTRSGLEALRKDSLNQNHVTVAMPYDLFFITKKFVNRLCPNCFLLVETDLWPCLLWDLHKHGCKIILANGSISSNSAKRLQKIPRLARFLYGPFTKLCMQSNDDAKRLKGLGIGHDKIEVLGNLKSDIIPPAITDQVRKRLMEATGFPITSPILCAGSTHEPEEKILLEAFLRLRRHHKDLKMILAPRDVRRGKEIERICSQLSLTYRSRSKGPKRNNPDIYILDTLGELQKFYAICHLAFVGGSLAPVGGHNLLEPIHLGRPVIFGPHVESCQEVARALMEKGAGFMVTDQIALEKTTEKLLPASSSYDSAKKAAIDFSRSIRGVAGRYAEMVKTLLHNNDNL